MSNNLKKIEKDLRAFAKRCKDVKYTQALLYIFLMTGTLSFTATTAESIEGARKEIKTSITDMKKLFKDAKRENNKLMKQSNLELIQLMEQGDHVVKSPWSSWQYGENYYYNGWNGTYKGRGDKKEKYFFESPFERANPNELGGWEQRYINPTGPGFEKMNRGLSNFTSGKNTDRNGLALSSYGLTDLNDLTEPVVELVLNASIRPKAVNRVPITVTEPATPAALGLAPANINIPSFNPVAPNIEVPTPETPHIFNIKLGSYCNGMVACGNGTNGGGYTSTEHPGGIGTPNSFSGGGVINIADTTNPSVRYSWSSTGSVLLKSFFDYTGGTGTSTVTQDLTVTSINNLSTTEKQGEAGLPNNRPYNAQKFLVGGARVATVDNITNGSLINNAEINLIGPLTVGYEVQTDTHGASGGLREVENKKLITDEGERTSTELDSVLGKGQSTTLALAPLLGNETVTVKRTAEGFTGYKVGLILTFEQDDTRSNSIYRLKNGLGGKITFNGEKSIGIQIYAPGSNSTIIQALNSGTITTNGASSYGMKLSSSIDTTNSKFENEQNGTINVGGSGDSAGMAILEDLSLSTLLKAGTDMVQNKGTINVTGKNNSGMFLKTQFDDKITNAASGKIYLGKDADDTISEGNIGIRIDKGQNAAPPAKQTGENLGIIELKGGKKNIGMFANGSTASVENKNQITISGGESNTGIMGGADGKFKNTNKITISGGTKNVGMLIPKGHTGLSGATSTIEVTGGTQNAGVVNYGTYDQAGSTVNAKGISSIAVYSGKKAATDPAPTTKINGNITVSTGAVALFPEKSTMEVANGANITVDNGGLFYFNYTNGTSNPEGHLNVTGASHTVTIKNGGNAFYIKGALGTQNTVTDTIIGSQRLNLHMENGSRLFVFDGSGVTTKVSQVQTPTNGALTIGNINVTGTGYKFYTSNRATLEIDEKINLNEAGNKYHSVDFVSSNVVINNVMTNNGAALSNGDNYVVGQGNSGTNVSDVKVTNNSTIELTGTPNLTAIATDFSVIENNGTVTNTGNKGIGLFGGNSSQVINNGTVTVGDEGAAIFGRNALGTGTSGNIDLTNNGTINVTGYKSYGMVADNTVAGKTSTVTLGGNSNITTLQGNEGVGVYAKNTTLNNNGGTITVGNKGVGIQGDNSVLNLTGGTIDVQGADAKGVYANNALTNTGTAINVNGGNSVGLFSTVSVNNGGVITVGDSADVSRPNIGIFSNVINNTGTINIGARSIGLYSSAATFNLSGGGINVSGEDSTGVYKNGGIIDVGDGAALSITGKNAIGVFSANGILNINRTSDLSIGSGAIGLTAVNGILNSNSARQTLGTDVIYAYARDNATLNNNTMISSSGDVSTALYAEGNSVINNNATLDMTGGKGNVGMLVLNGGAGINNSGVEIKVGTSNIDRNWYSIGMAGDGTSGALTRVQNYGTITVSGNSGIGMYGRGTGALVENYGDITLDADRATDSNPVKQMIGMYLDSAAKGINYGNIKTKGDYRNNDSVGGIVGVAAFGTDTAKAEFTNYGNIDINSDYGYGMFVQNAIIKNYGTINVNGKGSIGVYYKNATGINGNDIVDNVSSSNVDGEFNNTNPLSGGTGTLNVTGEDSTRTAVIKYDPQKRPVGGVQLKRDENGVLRAYVDGQLQIPETVNPEQTPSNNYMFSNIGVYIDTLGRTRAITGNAYRPTGKIDLVIGVEAAQKTGAKTIKIPWETVAPYLGTQTVGTKVNIYSAGLHWMASYEDGSASPTGEKYVLMRKIDYRKYAKDKDLYNFLDGLEQRYGVEGIGTREKALFNALNGIGDNESIVWVQAVDEMMGRQYANVQQRIYATGTELDKQFGQLQKEWRTTSKQSNKITSFGTRGEYKTETAGIKDYTNNAYGVAYLHENETVKLGNSSGWYAGAVHNTFKFKDIGKSKEKTLMFKAGVFKSKAFDHNGSLKWTVSGEGYAARSEMDRRYWVAEDIFKAESNYNSYGVAIKNEIGKDFRIGERFSIIPYGSLKLEYGRFNTIKEKKGEMRLEVKANDYYSVNPEVGVEFKYKQPMAVKTTFVTTLGLSYNNELGKVSDGKNKLRVGYTEADWYNIRGEKDDRKGNFKADLNIGVENQRFGVTLNGGYDTKGKNVRGGLGFRIIY